MGLRSYKILKAESRGGLKIIAEVEMTSSSGKKYFWNGETSITSDLDAHAKILALIAIHEADEAKQAAPRPTTFVDALVGRTIDASIPGTIVDAG